MVKETGYGLIRYSKKTGKCDMALTGMGDAMLNLWGLQNTTKTKETVVFDLETGLITARYIGSADGFPKVDKDIKNNFKEFIDEDIRIALVEDWTNRK